MAESIDEFTMADDRGPRLTVVHRERADDLVVNPDRRRPARRQTVLGRQCPEVVPARVGSNVVGDNRLTPKGRSSTRPRLLAGLQTVDGA